MAFWRHCPTFIYCLNYLALVREKTCGIPSSEPQGMLPSTQLLKKRPKSGMTLSPAVPRETMLCLSDGPEERHFIKMCFPDWEIKLRLLFLVLSRPPTWEHLQLGARADIFRNGYWFGISPKAPIHPQTWPYAILKHSSWCANNYSSYFYFPRLPWDNSTTHSPHKRVCTPIYTYIHMHIQVHI